MSHRPGGGPPYDGVITAELTEATAGVGKLVLGTLGDDLYVWGNADAPNTGLKGIRRLKKSAAAWETLTTTVTPGTHQFSGNDGYGAVEYKGKLYCGTTSGGRLFRLNLNADGSFASITLLNLAAGNEDVHPGPVLWGQLILGTYGANERVPEVYRWDGSAGTATLVVGSDFVGTGGLCASMVPYQGRLWVSIVKEGTGCEIYAIAPDWSAQLMYQGSQCWRFADVNGELVGWRTEGAAPLAVFRDGVWVNITAGDAVTGPHFAVGDELFGFDYYNGPYRYRYDAVETGPLTLPVNGNGHVYPLFWNGALWWSSQQTSQTLYRLPIGSDRPARQFARHHRNLGGRFAEVKVRSVASLPTAAAAWRGTMLRVEGGAGVADVTYICNKKADDTYAWQTIGVS